MTNETLTMEQLDLVSGGNEAEDYVDIGFFQQLDYNMARADLEDVFADNGVRYSHEHYDPNNYSILGQKYPHWAVLGYVLKKRNYTGFNGSWTDSNYTKSFLKEHFHIRNV